MYKAFLNVEGPHLVYAQKSDHLTCFTREVVEEMEILKTVDLISGNFQWSRIPAKVVSPVITEAVLKKKWWEFIDWSCMVFTEYRWKRLADFALQLDWRGNMSVNWTEQRFFSPPFYFSKLFCVWGKPLIFLCCIFRYLSEK